MQNSRTSTGGPRLIVGAAPSDGTGLAAALARPVPYAHVIAVDGGFASLEAAGIVPDALYGDLDSLGYDPRNAEGGTAHKDAAAVATANTAAEPSRYASLPVVTFPPEKDDTDLALAIDAASSQGCVEAVVCGALGGRIDHTVANLQLLTRYAEKGMRLWCIGDDVAAVALAGNAEYGGGDTTGSRLPQKPDFVRFSEGAWGTCSVFASSACAYGVTEQGLAYTLDGATLSNTTPLGVSNELQGCPASISLANGTLWAFFPLEALPYCNYAGIPWDPHNSHVADKPSR